MRVSHPKPGGRTRETEIQRLVTVTHQFMTRNDDRNENNNHLVPNCASLIGHFDDRLSVPFRI